MRDSLDGFGAWARFVWVNGTIRPAGEATVSVFDRGILLGDGVYETLRAHRGKIFRWEGHRDRLAASLSAARIELPISLETLREGIRACLKENRLEEARVRLTITRGVGNPGFDLLPGSAPTTIIAASPWRPVAEERRRVGGSAIVASIRQTGRESLSPALKSISRVHLVLARMQAEDAGADEAILLGSAGEIREGTASNVFFVEKGRLRTPSLDCGILEGVTRGAVLELASQWGIPWEEGRYDSQRLASAEEIFMTNTSWGALPISRLDGRSVGEGRSGPIALRMGAGIAELVERECQ